MPKSLFTVLVLLSSLISARALALAKDDSALIRAIHDDRGVNYIEAGQMVVEEILPDDNQGLPHQKWLVRLSDNSSVELVYNSDMGDRVPLQVGEVMSAGGQLIMAQQGPLLHWLHSDPKQHRPDGYVYVNGTYYGK
ncbi:DUF3465 domain-containing protein [Bdellovibrio svalbardensis]|uniref:DUF3465 domain-containing protein n=1 Tax=Bdellovibrio svalbardensis TaxID=2972972 RepID=A0ABT6DJ15_9BACT|nr:DUF3465 domain-containing protein [Bdellovibrio svalbardensis]MDG0816825.1 DUF3465 domain-containing protein [Bdellovibrio svalbardensis]